MSSSGESTLFHSAFAGPQLENGWRWLREDTDGWQSGESGMAFQTNPGGLSSDLPSPPLLLHPLDGSNACEVTLTMPSPPGSFREQAGLFWYLSDTNYAKMVIEYGQDGVASIVLAREHHGDYTECARCPLDEDEAAEPTRLRLELSSDGSELSGCVVGAYFTRLIGSCPASQSTWGDNVELSTALSFGISAHGGAERGRTAYFEKFDGIAVQTNRVQWGSAADTVPQAMANPQVGNTPIQMVGSGYTPIQMPSAPQAQDEYAPPGPGAGWTLSANLSEEQRNQIAALLGESGLAGLDDADQDQDQDHEPGQPN